MTDSGEQTPENDPTEKSEDRGNRKQQEAEQSISVEVSLGRRAEESLATPEETLHLMIAAAKNYGFVVIDGDGRITSWNPGATKLFGWPEEEILNQPFARLFTEEDQQRGVPEAELKKAAEQGAADDDRWHVRRDGTKFWTHGVTTALKNDSVRGFVKIVRDLTEQKQAEERIRRSEQQHRNLVEQVSDYAIFRIDTQGRPTTWNRGVERVLGFAEEDFVGNDINRIFLTEDIKARVPQRELEEAERNGMASNTRWMRREDGTPFYAVGMTTALKDEQGRLVGFTKVMQDRTEQKRQSDELAEKSRQLAAANEQKDHFLAVLSHELRNPLAPIRTAAEIICDEESQNPTVREACDILRRQVQVMVRLVDDLLEANRITTGKVRLQKEAIDLREVAGRAVETTRSLVEGHSHKLSVVAS